MTVLTALFLAPLTFAQVSQAEKSNTAEQNAAVAEKEVITLSPFVVTSENDQGFVSANALSGSRLATDIKDTAVAYSVVNRELIEALNITDLNSAAEWTTNTHKFVDPAGGGDFYNITSPIQVRGAGNISQFRQRNFFPYFAPMDSSTVERYDFGRGPNSVLFGNGTLGGTQVSLTKRARFDKQATTLDLLFGSWNSYRATLDYNRPVSDKLAVRVAVALADREGWRDQDMENTKNLFTTVTYKLGRKTELRLDGEVGRQERAINPTVHRDFFAGWDGRTTYSGPLFNSQLANNATGGTAGPSGPGLAWNGDAAGITRRGSNYFVWDPSSGIDSTIMNYQNDPMTRGAATTTRTPAGSFVQGSLPAFNVGAAGLIYSLDMPEGLYDRAILGSDYEVPSKTFNNSIRGPLIVQRYKDLQLSLSHQVGDSLFFELAGDVNRVNNLIIQMNGRGLYDTYIDINRKLPNGVINPNFLQPYGDATYNEGIQIKDSESIRVAAAYIKDLGKWGHYSFNVMGGLLNQEQKGLNYGLSIKANADSRQWGNTDILRRRMYWNSTDRSYMPPVREMTFINFDWTNAASPVATTTKLTPEWIFLNSGANTNQTWAQNEYKYALGAVTAKFFKNRLVFMGAGRYDQFYSEIRYPVLQGDYPTSWNGSSLIWRPDAPADYFALTYWKKDANGNKLGNAAIAADSRPRTNNTAGVALRNTVYDGDRFRDDYNPPPIDNGKATYSIGSVFHVTKAFSVFADKAQSFILPTAATPTITGQVLPPVRAEGYDLGLRMYLFNQKLNVSLTRYNNKEFGSYEQPAATTGNINSLYQSNAINDNSTDGRNIRNFMDIVGGSQDIRDRLSEGYELEVTANLTRGWRVTLNAGLPKVYVMNRFPITRQYIQDHKDDFIQALSDAGGGLDTTQHPYDAPGLAYARPASEFPAGTILRDQVQAVNAYNSLYSNAANIVTGKQIANDQKNFNLFTDYSFQSGRLKGLRVGFGAQYRGQLVVGYRGADTIVDPANATRAIDDPSVDAYTPVRVPGRISYTASLGYRYRLKSKKELSFNLTVRNLLNSQDIIYVDPTVLRPKGNDYTSPARESFAQRASFVEPISFSFSTSLRL